MTAFIRYRIVSRWAIRAQEVRAQKPAFEALLDARVGLSSRGCTRVKEVRLSRRGEVEVVIVRLSRERGKEESDTVIELAKPY